MLLLTYTWARNYWHPSPNSTFIHITLELWPQGNCPLVSGYTNDGYTFPLYASIAVSYLMKNLDTWIDSVPVQNYWHPYEHAGNKWLHFVKFEQEIFVPLFPVDTAWSTQQASVDKTDWGTIQKRPKFPARLHSSVPSQGAVIMKIIRLVPSLPVVSHSFQSAPELLSWKLC